MISVSFQAALTAGNLRAALATALTIMSLKEAFSSAETAALNWLRKATASVISIAVVT
ncbi:hypothetical protein D3C86_1611240 [compost metagenome]